jgi:hypothetical protein
LFRRKFDLSAYLLFLYAGRRFDPNEASTEKLQFSAGEDDDVAAAECFFLFPQISSGFRPEAAHEFAQGTFGSSDWFFTAIIPWRVAKFDDVFLLLLARSLDSAFLCSSFVRRTSRNDA